MVDALLTRQDLLDRVLKTFYNEPLLNNAHRGDVAELIVHAALGKEWALVGLGWHPWDLQRGSGQERIRIQVKQCAALQLWGQTKKLAINFGWKSQPPSYFYEYYPGEDIESEGRFCELFVVAMHLATDQTKADQMNPAQWRFVVIPEHEIEKHQKTMVLSKVRKMWEEVSLPQLKDKVEQVIKQLET